MLIGSIGIGVIRNAFLNKAVLKLIMLHPSLTDLHISKFDSEKRFH